MSEREIINAIRDTYAKTWPNVLYSMANHTEELKADVVAKDTLIAELVGALEKFTPPSSEDNDWWWCPTCRDIIGGESVTTDQSCDICKTHLPHFQIDHAETNALVAKARLAQEGGDFEENLVVTKSILNGEGGGMANEDCPVCGGDDMINESTPCKTCHGNKAQEGETK